MTDPRQTNQLPEHVAEAKASWLDAHTAAVDAARTLLQTICDELHVTYGATGLTVEFEPYERFSTVRAEGLDDSFAYPPGVYVLMNAADDQQRWVDAADLIAGDSRGEPVCFTPTALKSADVAT